MKRLIELTTWYLWTTWYQRTRTWLCRKGHHARSIEHWTEYPSGGRYEGQVCDWCDEDLGTDSQMEGAFYVR